MNKRPTDEDLDRIETAATGATQGRWEAMDVPEPDSVWTADGWIVVRQGVGNVHHIATADPPTVLALVAEVRLLRNAVIDEAIAKRADDV